MFSVKMGLSRPGADDGSCDGSSRAKQTRWVLRQVLWDPVVPTCGEMGPVCSRDGHRDARGQRPACPAPPAPQDGQPATVSHPKGPPPPAPTQLCRKMRPRLSPSAPSLPAGTFPGTGTIVTLVLDVPRSPAARRLLSTVGFSRPWRCPLPHGSALSQRPNPNGDVGRTRLIPPLPPPTACPPSPIPYAVTLLPRSPLPPTTTQDSRAGDPTRPRGAGMLLACSVGAAVPRDPQSGRSLRLAKRWAVRWPEGRDGGRGRSRVPS